MTALYDLLPAVHRVRDADQGSPLRDLLDVVDREFGLLRGDIEQLYDDWFIETCEDWVVPYIGDLLGVTGLGGPGRSDATNARSSPTRSATGGAKAPWASWSSSPATSPAGPRRPSSSSSCWAGTSTSTTSVATAVGLPTYATRAVPSSPTQRSTPTPTRQTCATSTPAGVATTFPTSGCSCGGFRHTRSTGARPSEPEGDSRSIPWAGTCRLFYLLAAERAIEHLAAERNVEGPLRRRPLHDELARGVPATVAEDDGTDRYLDPGDPVFAVRLGNRFLRPDELSICDLGDPGRRAVAPALAAVDPVRGRLALRAGETLVARGLVGCGLLGRPGRRTVRSTCVGSRALDGRARGDG